MSHGAAFLLVFVAVGLSGLLVGLFLGAILF